MFAISKIVGLSEWIIDDSCFVMSCVADSFTLLDGLVAVGRSN